jgi:hypothetical protein
MNSIPCVNEVNHFQQRLHRINFHAANHRRLTCIRFWNNCARNLFAPCLDCDGQGTTDAPQPTIQRQLPNKETVRYLSFVQPSVSSNNAQRHGQIEPRSFFANVRRVVFLLFDA